MAWESTGQFCGTSVIVVSPNTHGVKRTQNEEGRRTPEGFGEHVE